MTEKEKLIKQKEKIENKLRIIRSKEASRKRKIDTRKKILIGGTIMAAVKNNDTEWKRIKKLLDKYLTSDRDRELFQLPPLPKEEAKGE